MTTCYSSKRILSNQHNSRFLFKTVDKLLVYLLILILFTKIAFFQSIRLGIPLDLTILDVDHPYQDSLSYYYPATLYELLETSQRTRQTVLVTS